MEDCDAKRKFLRERDTSLWEAVKNWAKDVAGKIRAIVDAYKGERMDSLNAITSAYGKDSAISKVLKNAIEQENQGVFRLYYLDTKKPPRYCREQRS